VSAAAALVRVNGMQAVIDDNIAIFVTDDTPNATGRPGNDAAMVNRITWSLTWKTWPARIGSSRPPAAASFF